MVPLGLRVMAAREDGWFNHSPPALGPPPPSPLASYCSVSRTAGDAASVEKTNQLEKDRFQSGEKLVSGGGFIRRRGSGEGKRGRVGRTIELTVKETQFLPELQQQIGAGPAARRPAPHMDVC